MADVLVAEDDRINRFVITRLLAARGHRVRGVGNGAEVLEALENGDFDILLMDARMPVLDGVATTQIIRTSRKPYADIPIIAVTACVLAEDQKRFLAAGMDHCVTKPFTMEHLQQSILSALDRKAA